MDHAFVVHLFFICLLAFVVFWLLLLWLFYFAVSLLQFFWSLAVHATHIKLLTGVSSRLYTSFSHQMFISVAREDCYKIEKKICSNYIGIGPWSFSFFPNFFCGTMASCGYSKYVGGD